MKNVVQLILYTIFESMRQREKERKRTKKCYLPIDNDIIICVTCHSVIVVYKIDDSKMKVHEPE